jgi:hypothetical protein
MFIEIGQHLPDLESYEVTIVCSVSGEEFESVMQYVTIKERLHIVSNPLNIVEGTV